MFLDKVIKRNRALVDATVNFHKSGLLEPDTYVVDVDTFLKNSKLILDKANSLDIKLYFMLKQIGRNPYLAKKLVEMGYIGAVVVDFRCGQLMKDHNIPIGNVGHLVQPPQSQLASFIDYGIDVFTVFSMEKLIEINKAAKKVNKVQDVIIKVSDEDDLFYSGQMSGIKNSDLKRFITKAKALNNIKIVGATAFPCYLYDEEVKQVVSTPNYESVKKAVEIMQAEGLDVKQINTPSTTSVSTLELMSEGIGNYGEPGHGLSGTTPAHAYADLEEVPAVLYLSEISHNFRGKSYCYGGGHYRRSHVENCLIVNKDLSEHKSKVYPVDDDSIDYYFEIKDPQEVSASVIMAFRFQMFVTRSKVVLIEGLSNNDPRIVGVYNGLGHVYETR